MSIPYSEILRPNEDDITGQWSRTGAASDWQALNQDVYNPNLASYLYVGKANQIFRVKMTDGIPNVESVETIPIYFVMSGQAGSEIPGIKLSIWKDAVKIMEQGLQINTGGAIRLFRHSFDVNPDWTEEEKKTLRVQMESLPSGAGYPPPYVVS